MGALTILVEVADTGQGRTPRIPPVTGTEAGMGRILSLLKNQRCSKTRTFSWLSIRYKVNIHHLESAADKCKDEIILLYSFYSSLLFAIITS